MEFKPPTFHGEPPVIELENPPREQLERHVAELLAVSDGVDASEITVTEVDGDIVLTGMVGSPAEIERAVEVARAVPGVGTIVLKLRLRDPLAGSGG